MEPRYQGPEIVTWVKSKSQMLTWPSYPATCQINVSMNNWFKVFYQEWKLDYIQLGIGYRYRYRWILTPYQLYMISKYVLPFYRLPFHVVDFFFCCATAFQFDVVTHSFLFWCLDFWYCFQETLSKTRAFSFTFLLGVLWFQVLCFNSKHILSSFLWLHIEEGNWTPIFYQAQKWTQYVFKIET